MPSDGDAHGSFGGCLVVVPVPLLALLAAMALARASKAPSSASEG